MPRDKLSLLLDELKNYLTYRKGEASISDLLSWIKERGGGELTLYALIEKAKKLNMVETVGVWISRELPVFYKFPSKVRLKKVGTLILKAPTKRPFESGVADIQEGIRIVSDYLRKYFSVGDLRIKRDLGSKLRDVDTVLREMERQGLIVFNRSYGVITATEKLLRKSAKLHEYM